MPCSPSGVKATRGWYPVDVRSLSCASRSRAVLSDHCGSCSIVFSVLRKVHPGPRRGTLLCPFQSTERTSCGLAVCYRKHSKPPVVESGGVGGYFTGITGSGDMYLAFFLA